MQEEMNTEDITNAESLYHAYQYEILMMNNISIYDVVRCIKERQAGHLNRFKKPLTIEEAFSYFEANGTGTPGEIPWDDFDRFCEKYINSYSTYTTTLIDRMFIKDDEKKKLREWLSQYRDEYNAMQAENDDIGDDDWLGPRPEHTWENAYGK